MDYALGTDVSRYEHPVNGELGVKRGLRFAYIRATIGDYYTDSKLEPMYWAYKNAGCLVGAYLVTAPRATDGGRQITADAHLDRFVNATSHLKFDLPHCLDAELERGETPVNITTLQKSVALGLALLQGRNPLIYTRMSWWDTWVKADPLWSACDLFAARYSAVLTSPWSDNKCRFRDWKTWKFWQYTASADATYWGWGENGSCHEGDLDYFNGDTYALYEYANLPAPISTDEWIKIILREARKAGWDLTP